MGSARSPSSPSASDPAYTHRAHNSAGHYEDEIKEGSTDCKQDDGGVSWESASGSHRRKKKKNKKERHGHHEFGRDPQQEQPNDHSASLPSAEKLPPIKISLRLPALSLATTVSDRTSHGVSASKKKRRVSEILEVGVDEGEDLDHGQDHQRFLEDSQDMQHETSHKKKKKKHRHRHRHPNHDSVDETLSLQDYQRHPPEPHSTLSTDHEHGQREGSELDLRYHSEHSEDVNPSQTSETEQEHNDYFQREETEQTENSQTLGADSREHSVKPAKKLKAQRRMLTPKLVTPAVPKKKELSVVCHKLLDGFIRKDSYVLFSHPVDPALVPDYSSVIKNPMDFSTMRAKVERGFYPNIEEFLADFKLVCDNARLYNSKETLYWKQADKLWDWGSRAIERDRKTIIEKDEDIMTVVKDEENLDVVGIGEHSLTSLQVVTPLQSKPPMMNVELSLDSPMSVGDPGRPHTPQQYRKSKKIKHRRDGTIAFSYSTDGSIDPASHPDPWSLVPIGDSFGSTPSLSNFMSGTSPYYGQLLDDYPYWKAPPASAVRAATALDYGAFSCISPTDSGSGNQAGIQNISAYTGMVFGDEQGESYVRSLAMFLEGVTDRSGPSKSGEQRSAGLLQVQDYIRENIERLTRGASSVADKVAIVIRDEVQEQNEADAHIPLAIWNQDFKTIEAERSRLELPVAEAIVVNTGRSIVEGKERERPTTHEESDMDAISSVGTKSLLSLPSQQQEHEQSNMIDIRQVVQDIRSWPDLQRKKTDYSLWRKFSIELDSLLLHSQSSTATATATNPADNSDESSSLTVRWGDKWTGGDSEENRKWVRSYLEQNSQEMRELAGILTTESKSDQTMDSTRLKLMESVRRRLIEMAKYVPLSEINSQKLPPPVALRSPVPSVSK